MRTLHDCWIFRLTWTILQLQSWWLSTYSKRSLLVEWPIYYSWENWNIGEYKIPFQCHDKILNKLMITKYFSFVVWSSSLRSPFVSLSNEIRNLTSPKSLYIGWSKRDSKPIAIPYWALLILNPVKIPHTQITHIIK